MEAREDLRARLGPAPPASLGGGRACWPRALTRFLLHLPRGSVSCPAPRQHTLAQCHLRPAPVTLGARGQWGRACVRERPGTCCAGPSGESHPVLTVRKGRRHQGLRWAGQEGPRDRPGTQLPRHPSGTACSRPHGLHLPPTPSSTRARVQVLGDVRGTSCSKGGFQGGGWSR